MFKEKEFIEKNNLTLQEMIIIKELIFNKKSYSQIADVLGSKGKTLQIKRGRVFYHLKKPHVKKAKEELELYVYNKKNKNTEKIMKEIITEEKNNILSRLDVLRKAERLEAEAREWSSKDQKYYGTVIAQSIGIMAKLAAELEDKLDKLNEKASTINVRFLHEGETQEDARRINLGLDGEED